MTRDASDRLAGALLTVGEVAGMLRVSTMTVYRLIKAGDLPALRVGRNYRIREADVATFLDQGAVARDEANG
ncbi:MAG: helix-turn-helix domain-containing protein [Nitriliruptoraceae bacterium]